MMNVGILSDIHDNIPVLRAALERLESADVLICCGDLCSPFIVKQFGDNFSRPIHIVFGNNDGDRFRIAAAAADYNNITVHGEFARLEFGGRRFAVNHFDDVGRAMVGCGDYDVVCFGHNHRFEIFREADTLVINPGEIYGLITGDSTCVIYDTTADEATRIDLD